MTRFSLTELASLESSTANTAPVGIFDSGLGGLAIYRAIREQLPAERTLYFADTAHCPYGDRAVDEIIARACQITEHLLANGAKAIVVACNTATVHAIATLRERYDVPFVGVEPGIKPASAASMTRTALLLATPRTLKSYSVERLQARHASDLTIIRQPCHGLVEQVEAGELDAPRTNELLAEFLRPVHDDNADVVILGCTHYIFVQPQIAKLTGPDVTVIEPAHAVATQLAARLAQEGLVAPAGDEPMAQFETSARDAAPVTQVATVLLGHPVNLTTANI